MLLREGCFDTLETTDGGRLYQTIKNRVGPLSTAMIAVVHSSHKSPEQKTYSLMGQIEQPLMCGMCGTPPFRSFAAVRWW
jgi:hypothetical protein